MGSGRVRVRSSVALGRGAAAGRARVRWSEALGERFLALVAETGNAQAAAAALGAPHAFNNRAQRDPVFRRRYREALAASGRGKVPVKRAAARWSPALGERFLGMVRETGNARAAAAALGAPNAFANRMRRDAGFRERVREAVAEADARLRAAAGAVPGGGAGTRTSTCRLGPATEGTLVYECPRPRTCPPAESGTRTSTCPLPLATDAVELGGFLKPGRKRAQEGPEPVIRRNARGQYQVTLAREGHWTRDIEADFLARLAATGNFDASARGVGFQPASVHQRARKWTAFQAACDAALEAADARLGYALVARAHAHLRGPGEARPEGEEEAPFDPEAAMRILGFLDARKAGGARRGPRKGPPDRSFDDAVESVLAKIEAIERHEALVAEEAGERKEAGQ